MPRRDIWVRKEDLEIWDSIPQDKRPKWLHTCLQEYAERGTRTIKLPQFDKPIRVPSTKGTCPNGHVADEWGKCLMKGCKYGR